MKFSLDKLFRNMKIYKKLLISYLIIFSLPICFTIFFVVPKVAQETVNQSITINQISFQQLKDNITNQFYNYIRIVENVATEAELGKYLTRPYIEGETYGDKYFEYYKLISFFKSKFILHTMDGIRINLFSKNKNILYGNDLIYRIDDKIEKELWYKKTVEANGMMVISDVFLDSYDKYNISISKCILYGEASEEINIVRIIIPVESLVKFMEKEALNKEIYIVSQYDDIIVASSPVAIGTNLEDSQYKVMRNLQYNDLSIINRKDIRENIVFQGTLGTKLPLKGYRIIYSISPSVILGKTNEIVNYSVLIYIISVIIAVFFILAFSNTLTSRLKVLVKSMNGVKGDQLSVHLDNEDRDEIGELSRNFNSLMNRISTLINEVYIQKMSFQELELKQRETEFLALQTQINPHFLFNTIESIRMKALTNGDEDTSEMLERFGELLRKSMDWSSRFVTLEQELSLVENYMIIQKFRYGSRFDYKINLSFGIPNILIPKFIIQPIVENAISHGLEMKKNGGILDISIYKQEERLVIIVQDNGVGITKERLIEVRQSMENVDNISSSSSIGLKNVFQRIKLMYGNDYGIDIDSNVFDGTKVVITLPINSRKED